MIKSLKAGRKRAAAVVSFVAVLTLGVAGTAPKPVYAGPDSKAAQRVSVTQLDQAFTAMDYDFEHLLENGGSVPRILLADLPQGLSKIKDTQARKHMFFKTVLPLVLSVNEDLAEQRARLWVLHAAIAIGQPLSAADQRWFAHMSELYETQPGDLNALFQKVDQIPVSLALVQAAEESGWGRSRFAREGNALFGQWTYGSGGMTPKHRKAGKSHKVKAFDTLEDSVRAYMHNLNTHPAYRKFRSLRAEQREKGIPLQGEVLVAGLDKYSERGAAYITGVRKMIRYNDLAALDGTLRLRDPAASQVFVLNDLNLPVLD